MSKHGNILEKVLKSEGCPVVLRNEEVTQIVQMFEQASTSDKCKTKTPVDATYVTESSFIMSSSELKSILQKLGQVKRNFKHTPILNDIMICANSNALRFIATNLRETVCVTVPINRDMGFSMVVSDKVLAATLKGEDTATLNFTNSKELTVNVGGVVSKLDMPFDSKDFLAIPKLTPTDEFIVDCREFYERLSRVTVKLEIFGKVLNVKLLDSAETVRTEALISLLTVETDIFKTCLNLSYLQDALQCVDSETLTLRCTDKKSDFVQVCGNNFMSVIGSIVLKGDRQ